MSAKVVSVLIDGVRTTHLPDWSGSYATLCGVDGNDPELRQQVLSEEDVNSIVDCTACTRIWQVCRRFPPRTFAKL